MDKKLLTLDVILKYVVLILFSLYVGLCFYANLIMKIEVNLPDWIVCISTLIFQYFFRRSPKGEQKESNNV